MQTLLPEYKFANTAKVNITNAGNSIPSVGLTIPFQPCTEDAITIQMRLRSAAIAVQARMKDSYDEACINNVLARVEKLFSTLNYNSYCKSISLILTTAEEKVIYLNYPVKPVAYVSEHVSLLHVAANTDRQPEFYFLFFRESNATLYEYHHNRLHRVYIKSQPLCLDGKVDDAGLFKQVAQTIHLLNRKEEKPVFVAGSPNVVESFSNTSYFTNIFFTLLYEVAPFCESVRNALAKEVSNRWEYWQAKFVAGRIAIAQKAGCLISNVEAVLKALSHSADGWLLLDKNLKRQLYKSGRVNALFYKSDEMKNQIERFLKRGNSIGITEAGFLKNFGGIILLQSNNCSFYSTTII